MLTHHFFVYITYNYFSLSSLFLQCTVKKKEETFSAHLSGTLPHDQELQLSLSADIFNSIQDLAALPNSASLVGVLTQSKGLTEGKSKINVLMHLLSVQIHLSVKKVQF